MTTITTYQALVQAVQTALRGDWHAAHEIAQTYNTPIANWIHAVLHKIEPDEWNSRYWYQRSGGRNYTDFEDPTLEFQAILAVLEKGTE